MKFKTGCDKFARLALVAVALNLSGCFNTTKASTHTTQLSDPAYIQQSGTQQGRTFAQPADGVVPEVWEEPMVDVVQVPPGLDPEGHYYRPAHKEIVEIRQGRWQYLRESKQRSGQ